MTHFFQRRWFLLLIAAGIALALTQPALVGAVVGPVPVRFVAAIVLGLMSLGLPASRLRAALSRPLPTLTALAISYGLAPLLTRAAALVLLPDELQVGMVIAGAVPCTLASATIWTRLAGGNEAISLLVTMLSNTTVFLFTPVWLSQLTGRHVQLPVAGMMADLVVYVVAPIVTGQGIRRSARFSAVADRHRLVLGIVCRLLILLIITKSTVNAQSALVASGVARATQNLIVVAFACSSVHLTLLATGYLIGKLFCDREDAIAMAFASSQKTLPVGALIVDEFYRPYPLAIVPILVFHVGQLLIDTYVAEFFYHRQRAEPTPAAETPVMEVDTA
jgi:sodium/bile acid cotransporter 7